MWYELRDYSRYEIDEKGDVRNKSTLHVLKRQKHSNVFCYTLVGDDERLHKEYVHFLLAYNFIVNPNGYKYVEFKDENPYNLSLNNLYWSRERKNSRRRNYSVIENDILYRERHKEIVRIYGEIDRLEKEIENIYDKWVPIKGFSLYEINRRGEIRNQSTKKQLKPVLGVREYYTNTLLNDEGKKKLVCIHRLVAIQFIPNPNNLEIVHHIDENKLNNDVLNLQWVTRKQNSNHGTGPSRIAEKRNIPVNEYDCKGKYIRTWKSIKAFADYYGIDKSQVTPHMRSEKGFCMGRIVKRYEGNRLDLNPKEVKKRGICRFPKKKIDNSIPIPREALYIEKGICFDDIFEYYESCSGIDYKKLRNDIRKIYEEINYLEREIARYDRF